MTFFAALPFFCYGTLLSAYFQADFFGKCIFFGLFSLSILCWVILVYKTVQMKRAKTISAHFKEFLDKNLERIMTVSMEEFPQSRLNPFAHIFKTLRQKTVEVLSKNQFFSEEKDLVYLTPSDLELLESHALVTISTQIKSLEKHLFVLSTIEKLAPFLGLLGTVWGILVTFSQLQAGGDVTSNTAMLGGISTALATTVLGLVIAIPALIFYNYLKSKLKGIVSDMEDFLYILLSTIELQYRRP